MGVLWNSHFCFLLFIIFYWEFHMRISIHAYNILIEYIIHLACSCTVFIHYIFSFINWSKWILADTILVACMNAFLNACMYIICVQCSMRANNSLGLGYTQDGIYSIWLRILLGSSVKAAHALNHRMLSLAQNYI